MTEKYDIVETTKSKGDALEKSVEFIFNTAGFETERNTHIAKYEIDVLAKVGDRDIVIECKNYQNSSLIIRNLIHQWSSKNNLIKASKIIIVMAGLKIKPTDQKLADDLDIELWDDNIISELFNLTLKPSELREKLISKIDFTPISISKLYKDKILEMVIYPQLGCAVTDEVVYNNFINWLSAFIRTELQVTGTTKEDRLKHIQLFEDTKQRKGFLNIKFNRSSEDYWNLLAENLDNKILLNKSVAKKYSKYMDELVEEYNQQVDYFSKKKGKDKLESLIKYRLYNSLISKNDVCEFKVVDGSSSVIVKSSGEGQFILEIRDISNKNAEIISWILTSEYYQYLESITDTNNCIVYQWFFTSLEEAAEKTYRILDEFFGAEDNIIDLRL